MGGRSFLRAQRKQDISLILIKESNNEKVDQAKVETAAEIYSNIKMKTMVAVTASFFGLMVLAFISIFLKA